MPFSSLRLPLMLFAASLAAAGENIPEAIHGKWRISRQVPTTTIACWGDKEAKAILGTGIEYTANTFRWKSSLVKPADAVVSVITANEFRTENSGGGSAGSRVDFGQLGIKAASVKQIRINHSGDQIPGDSVLVAGPNTLVFSVCNVYFRAIKVR